MSLRRPAGRAEGLRCHGDMRRLAGTAVAAGGLMRRMTSLVHVTDGVMRRLKCSFRDNQVLLEQQSVCVCLFLLFGSVGFLLSAAHSDFY